MPWDPVHDCPVKSLSVLSLLATYSYHSRLLHQFLFYSMGMQFLATNPAKSASRQLNEYPGPVDLLVGREDVYIIT